MSTLANHEKYIRQKCVALNINGITNDAGKISSDPTMLLACGREAKDLRGAVEGIYEKYKRGPRGIKTMEKVEEIYDRVRALVPGGPLIDVDGVELDLQSTYDEGGIRETFTIAIRGLGDELRWDLDPRLADRLFRGLEKEALYRL